MEPDKKIPNAVVETYAEDMAEVMASEGGSLVKKIIRGDEEREMEKKNLSPESKKNRAFMYGGIALFVLALGILGFFSIRNTATIAPVAPQFAPLIFSDKSAYLEISGFKTEEIVQTVAHEILSTTVKTGGLEGIYLTENKQPIGLRKFLSLIKSTFAPVSSEDLISGNFLLGTVNTKDAAPDGEMGNGFFILIKVRSMADIFANLHAWERKMFSELHGFLGIDITKDNSYLLTKDFEDGIVENKNARILSDKDGNPVLMYIFADDNSVIVTGSKDAAREVILRLTSSQTKQ